MGSGEPRISRTDRNRGRSCTRSKVLTNRCNAYGWVAYLITDAKYIFLATITTGGVLLAVLYSDDKSLRVGNLDKTVRVLLRCDPLMCVSIIERTKRRSPTRNTACTYHSQGSPCISKTL